MAAAGRQQMMAGAQVAGAQPDVSTTTVDVGVVTWNTREISIMALRRLLDGAPGCRLRLLVRDNGSTDGTAAAITKAVPEAELDAGDTNLGFGAGMNRLLVHSRADWFLALNSDAWPEPGAVGALVRAGSFHPRAAAVAPRLERPDGTLEHSTHPFPSVRVAAATAVASSRWLPRRWSEELCLERAWHHDRPRRVDWAVGAALLMRRAALDELGGFDEGFFMYAEDIEWCWRARQGGWHVWFEPSAVVRHLGNASGARRYGDGRARAVFDSTYRFYRAEHGAAATAAYRALNLAGAGRNYAAALLRRDTARRWYWRTQLAAHIGRGHHASGCGVAP